MRNRFLLYLLFSLHGLILFLLTSCSSSVVNEAKDVVNSAEYSQAAGNKNGDSVILADTYYTYAKRRLFYQTEYAQACYLYGNLLEDKGHPVEAMKCFIRATHAHTQDYLLLGYVYTRMGEISNKANDHQLACDMYDLSARYFLRASDTLRYCKVVQLQAMELAKQEKKEEAFLLLKQNETYLTDANQQQAILMTKSQIFMQIEQLDSAFYYLKASMLWGETDSARIASVAETFSFLENLLALYYQEKQNDTEGTFDVTKLTNMIFGQVQMGDTSLSIASEEEYVQATQILWHDIHRQKSFAWIYSILATLLVVLIIIAIYLHYQEDKHALISQKITDATLEYTGIQNDKKAEIESTCEVLCASDSLSKDLCWREYGKMCEKIDSLFFLLAGKLQQKQVLNETEIRLCVLILIGMSHDRIALTLPYARNSIGKLKDQTAKKLGTTGRNLREFLINLAVTA